MENTAYRVIAQMGDKVTKTEWMGLSSANRWFDMLKMGNEVVRIEGDFASDNVKFYDRRIV